MHKDFMNNPASFLNDFKRLTATRFNSSLDQYASKKSIQHHSRNLSLSANYTTPMRSHKRPNYDINLDLNLGKGKTNIMNRRRKIQ